MRKPKDQIILGIDGSRLMHAVCRIRTTVPRMFQGGLPAWPEASSHRYTYLGIARRSRHRAARTVTIDMGGIRFLVEPSEIGAELADLRVPTACFGRAGHARPGARRAVTRGHPPVPPPRHCGRRRQPLPSGAAGHAAPDPTSLRSDEHAAAVYGEDGASRVFLLHEVQVAAGQVARLADSADRQRAAVRAEQFVPHVRRELPPQLGAH